MKRMAICFTLFFGIAPFIYSAPPEAETKAQQLVEQLASDSFRQRELAARELIRLGSASKPALQKGALSNDPEVAHRCQRLLPLAYAHYVQEVLSNYLAEPTGPLPEELPGAKRFIETVGLSKESTERYIELVNKHRDILMQMTEKPHTVTDLYQKYVQELYARVRNVNGIGGINSSILTDAELLMFLFLATDPKLNRETINNAVGVNSYLPTYYILNQTRLATLLNAKDGSPVFKQFFVEFVGSQKNPNIMRRAIQLAATAELRECIPAAIQLAKDKNAVGTSRAYALTALSKLATKDDLHHLIPLLEDKAVVATVFVNNVNGNNVNKQVEVRDIALGVILLICKQTMTEFGFERNPPNYASPTITISYTYFVFASDEKRAEAFKKWTEYAKKEKLVK